MNKQMQKFVTVAPRIGAAIACGRPVVALETTLLTHGLPYPQNLSTAQAVEKLVREAGAEPAHLALLNGKIVVGLSEEELAFISHGGPAIPTATCSELPQLLAGGKDASLAADAVLHIAAACGIDVVATAGIDGMLRGAGGLQPSADLRELAKAPLLLVCSGFRSILDDEAGRDQLAAVGVQLLGYGCTTLPGYYCRGGKAAVDVQADTPQQAAALRFHQQALGLGATMLANPAPLSSAMEEAQLESAVRQALAAAQRQGISGKAVTPFLLEWIRSFTGGRSLQLSIELLYNNAKLAAQVAVSLSDMRTKLLTE